MIANLLAAALLLTGARDNNASPTGTTMAARMTVSKMRMADLESSAGGYAYNQRPGLPVSYVRYTNHGSGRYYHAPAPVHYVAGSPAPVAPAVSETALPHEPAPLAYATITRHEIAPYAARQPYPRDGFINYGAGQLAKYAQPLEPPKPTAAARAPYYASQPRAQAAERSGDKRSAGEDENGSDRDDGNNSNDDYDDYDDDGDDDAGNYGDDDGDEKERGSKEHAAKNRGRATDSADDHRPDIDVSFGTRYSAARNSARGEEANGGYYKRKEFDVGERGRHDGGRQLGRTFVYPPDAHLLIFQRYTLCWYLRVFRRIPDM